MLEGEPPLRGTKLLKRRKGLKSKEEGEMSYVRDNEQIMICFLVIIRRPTAINPENSFDLILT